MNLFRPDVHSQPGPSWGPIRAEWWSSIRYVLREFWGLSLEGGDIVEMAGAASINSVNLRILPLRLVLKRLPLESSRVGYRLALLVAMSANVPIPPHLSGTGGFLIEWGGFAWALMPYLPGAHFSGRAREFQGLPAFVASAHAALERVNIVDLPARPVISDEQCDYARRGGAGKVVDEVAEARPELAAPLLPGHIDLHCHNLLCRDDRVVALMDVDSIRAAPWTTVLGYAAFKLTRQHIVEEALPTRAERQAAAEWFVGGLGPCVRDRTLLWLGAKAEILRRVAYIQEYQETKGGTPWIIDLPRHLAALQEIEDMQP